MYSFLHTCVFYYDKYLNVLNNKLSSRAMFLVITQINTKQKIIVSVLGI